MTNIIAPYFLDLSTLEGGTISYKISSEMSLMTYISYNILNNSQKYFLPTKAFIVTWVQVKVKGENMNVSFQVFLATYMSTSYLGLLYGGLDAFKTFKKLSDFILIFYKKH